MSQRYTTETSSLLKQTKHQHNPWKKVALFGIPVTAIIVYLLTYYVYVINIQQVSDHIDDKNEVVALKNNKVAMVPDLIKKAIMALNTTIVLDKDIERNLNITPEVAIPAMVSLYGYPSNYVVEIYNSQIDWVRVYRYGYISSALSQYMTALWTYYSVFSGQYGTGPMGIQVYNQYSWQNIASVQFIVGMDCMVMSYTQGMKYRIANYAVGSNGCCVIQIYWDLWLGVTSEIYRC